MYAAHKLNQAPTFHSFHRFQIKPLNAPRLTQTHIQLPLLETSSSFSPPCTDHPSKPKSNI